LRPGTENVPGIVGLATALRLAVQDLGDETARVGSLRDRLEVGIRERVADVYPNGHPEQRVPNIANLSFAGVEGESLLLALDMKGIAVSTGSACNAGATEPSHVLRAMGLDWTLAQGSLRFSLGRTNTESEVDYAIQAVTEVVERLRQVSPLYRQPAC
jgi:cysteine desulfurase